MTYDIDDYTIDDENDEYLTRVVVNVAARFFVMYSNEGTERKVECENVDDFMDVLEMVRALADDDIVHYISPVVITSGKSDF